MWLDALAQFPDRSDIFRCGIELSIPTLFVEREIQKKHLSKFQTEDLARGTRLGLSDQSFELAQDRTVFVEGSFFLQLLRKLIQPILTRAPGGTISIQFVEKTDCHPGFVVGHAKIAGSQVSKRDFMLMTAQSMEGTGHSEFGIQRFRTENQDPFVGRVRRDGPVRIGGIRLSTWPTCNGVLQLIENPNIQTVGRPGLEKKLR
jgi:hypothetical protein